MAYFIPSDWHIHSEASCDEACLPMRRLPGDAAAAGVVRFGVSDHLHTPCNLPDLEASRAAYLACRQEGFHFGVEVSSVSRWELDRIRDEGLTPTYGLRSGGPAGAACAIGLAAGDIARLRIEYVVAGTHWPLYVPCEREALIRDYHRQNMFLATHPEVDIVAHPWWWMGPFREDDGGYRTDPWFSDFGLIPRSMHDEFAAALLQTGTCCELNLYAVLLNRHYPLPMRMQYMEYIRELFERGVGITVGSDCHGDRYENLQEAVAPFMQAVGFGAGDFSEPAFREYAEAPDSRL